MTSTGTIRVYRCQHCRKANEVRWRGFVPAGFLNDARDALRRVTEAADVEAARRIARKALDP